MEVFQNITIFALCSLINVMLSTIKTIIMYKNEKLSSSLINAITYGFYTIVVVLMAGDMDLWLKVLLTAITNFIGVWLSMSLLNKLRKDNLWKVEATVPQEKFHEYKEMLEMFTVPHNYVDIGKYYLVNFYCSTSKQSELVKEFLKDLNAKYFVTESKTL